MYINVGVRHGKYGQRVATKKALRAAIAADPISIWADSTSPLGSQFNNSVDMLPEGVKLSVVGPDPYASRLWYATIERTSKGLRVS